MKTFETEKHNIPKGATHYRDECNDWHFLWLKNCPTRGWCKCDSAGYHRASWIEGDMVNKIKQIPEDKPLDAVEKVEWEKLEFNSAWEAVKAFEDGKVLYVKRSHKDFILIETAPDVLRFLYQLYHIAETPEAKKEREELEAAYDLYNSCSQYGELDYEDFVAGVHSTELIQWLQVVRKTGYKLGE